VVGVNTAVAGVGLGLAVPINDATRKIVGALMTDGRYRRAYLGIAGGQRPLPPAIRGRFGGGDAIEVAEVQPGTPAERAGLRAEDLILSVNGERVGSVVAAPAAPGPRTEVDVRSRLLAIALRGVKIQVGDSEGAD
jgi:S1-C subfamily serine protease